MDNEINIELYKHPPKFKERIITDKEKDYAYYSEALHSSYLFYTMEVDRLNKQLLVEQAKNKKLIKDFGAKYIEWEKTFLDNKKLVEEKAIYERALKLMWFQCEQNNRCLKNSKGCIAYTYKEDCFKYQAQQALNEVNK